jgi:hypothetical protein
MNASCFWQGAFFFVLHVSFLSLWQHQVVHEYLDCSSSFLESFFSLLCDPRERA